MIWKFHGNPYVLSMIIPWNIHGVTMDLTSCFPRRTYGAQTIEFEVGKKPENFRETARILHGVNMIDIIDFIPWFSMECPWCANHTNFRWTKTYENSTTVKVLCVLYSAVVTHIQYLLYNTNRNRYALYTCICLYYKCNTMTKMHCSNKLDVNSTFLVICLTSFNLTMQSKWNRLYTSHSNKYIVTDHCWKFMKSL